MKHTNDELWHQQRENFLTNHKDILAGEAKDLRMAKSALQLRIEKIDRRLNKTLKSLRSLNG